MQRQGHILGLDVLRFFAASIVVIFHFTPSFLPFGWVGVQIFFVISGFVIANSAMSSTVWRFARARILRLYPGAWTALAFNALALLLIPAAGYAALGIYTALTPKSLINGTLLFSGSSVSSAYWTLPVEIAFYALVGVLMMVFRALNPIGIAAGLLIWSGPYLLAFLLSLAGIVPFKVDLGYGLLNMSLLRHGPYFALGILLFETTQRPLPVRGRMLLGLALVLCLAEILTRSEELSRLMSLRANPVIEVVPLYLWAAGVFLGALAAFYAALKLNADLRISAATTGIVRMLGLTTYPLYLVHECVGGGLMYLLGVAGLSKGWAVAGAFAGTALLAAGIAMRLEPALRRMMQRWLPETPPARLAGFAPVLTR